MIDVSGDTWRQQILSEDWSTALTQDQDKNTMLSFQSFKNVDKNLKVGSYNEREVDTQREALHQKRIAPYPATPGLLNTSSAVSNPTVSEILNGTSGSATTISPTKMFTNKKILEMSGNGDANGWCI